MTKPKWYCSLRIKGLIVTLLAVGCAVGVYFLGNSLGDMAINHWYLTEKRMEQRNAVQTDNFQKFVTENGIASTNSGAMSKWVANAYAYIVLIRDGRTSFEAGWWGIDEDADIGMTEEEQAEEYDFTFSDITFTDGTFRVAVEDYSEYRLYDETTDASYILAFFTLLLIVLLYQGRATRRMISISRALSDISAGDLQKEIPVKGHDEIAALSININSMRTAIITQMRREQIAWQANSDLIKSMSHDVRNPLTTLIGYLDLARTSKEPVPEDVQEYIDICARKADQLKELTDELFQYFLVFGSQDLKLNMERIEADPLLEQMIGEHLVELERCGWHVKRSRTCGGGMLYVDVAQLNRVFDNLFSNIKKYADPERPIVISAEPGNNKIHILLENEIAQTEEHRESNGIGLKTCEKILSKMGGSFQTSGTKQRFSAVICLPVSAED